MNQIFEPSVFKDLCLGMPNNPMPNAVWCVSEPNLEDFKHEPPKRDPQHLVGVNRNIITGT